APTHWLPIRLNAELRGVDLNLLKTVAFSPNLDSPEMLEAIKQEALRILLLFFLKVVALGVLGSVFLLFMGGIRQPRQLFLGGVAAALFIILLVGVLYATYDISGFEHLE